MYAILALRSYIVCAPFLRPYRLHCILIMTVCTGMGHGRDSREITISKGRRRIQQVASALRLTSHHVDAAVRLFTLAVQHNFIQG